MTRIVIYRGEFLAANEIAVRRLTEMHAVPTYEETHTMEAGMHAGQSAQLDRLQGIAASLTTPDEIAQDVAPEIALGGIVLEEFWTERHPEYGDLSEADQKALALGYMSQVCAQGFTALVEPEADPRSLRFESEGFATA